MEGLLLIYALTITLELVLSLVMALTLFVVLLPRQAELDDEVVELERPRRFAPTVTGALSDAFESLSRGRDDVPTLVHARHMLAVYLREQAPEGRRG